MGVEGILHAQDEIAAHSIETRIRGLLANEWISAAFIFVLTRVVALLGAYSGISSLVAVEPTRNKGWSIELGLMWDAAHYATIAQQHYSYDPASPGGSNVAFAPLFPFLVWLLSLVLGAVTLGWDWGNAQWGTAVASGLLISNVSFYLALVLLVKLLAPRLGNLRAALVAFALAVLPLSFFFSAMYTEGLFLLLLVSAFLVARSTWQFKWLCAGLLGMLAMLDRFAGFLLLPVLAVEYMSQAGWKWGKVRVEIAWLLLVPLGLGIYLGFLWWRFGTPLALYSSMLNGWNHTGSFFLTTYWNSLADLWRSLTGAVSLASDPLLVHVPVESRDHLPTGARLFAFLDLGMPLLLLAGGFLARKKLFASEWALLVLGIVYPLSTNITFSLARYVLPLWPGLLWVGTIKGSKLWLAVSLTLLSLGLLAWCSRIYGSARWIG
jgi:hypothetical protein